eukprot:SAG22_NODE_22245_length_236_cov_16.948905_1_plen_50_part_10
MILEEISVFRPTPPVLRRDDATEYTSTLHDRLGRQITRDGSIKFKPGTLR